MKKETIEETRQRIREVGGGPAIGGVYALDDYDHDGNLIAENLHAGVGVLGADFDRAADALRQAASEFGANYRMLGDGTIIDTPTYNSMKHHWASKLP